MNKLQAKKKIYRSCRRNCIRVYGDSRNRIDYWIWHFISKGLLCLSILLKMTDSEKWNEKS